MCVCVCVCVCVFVCVCEIHEYGIFHFPIDLPFEEHKRIPPNYQENVSGK